MAPSGAGAAANPHLELQVIRPSRGWTGLQLAELWRYRELLFTFTWRNVLVRYKQTVLGILWAVIQPVSQMLVFTILLGHVAGIKAPNGLPYPLFLFAGLLPWTMFANSLAQSAVSMVANSNLLRKIYFPRLIIPVSTVLTALVDFIVASAILVVLMVVYHTYPEPIRLLALPGLVLLAMGGALGVGLWLAALNVTYRDVAYIVPFLSQMWLLLTPAVYLKPIHSSVYQTIVAVNPMQGVILGFRWTFLGRSPGPGYPLLVSAAMIAVLLASGLVYFRRTERTFADVV